MGRQRIIYRETDGKVEKSETQSPALRDFTMPDMKTRMQQTLYQLECTEGSRWKFPGFSKEQLKKVWWG